MANKYISIVIAFIGFAGAYLGATIGASSSYQVQKLEGLQSLRNEMYLSLFNAQAKHIHANSMSYPEAKTSREKLLNEYEFETKEARLRLAAFAPSEMVNNLFSYYKNAYGYSENCNPNWKSDAAIYISLREQLLPEAEPGSVDERTIYAVMFNCLPPLGD